MAQKKKNQFCAKRNSRGQFSRRGKMVCSARRGRKARGRRNLPLIGDSLRVPVGRDGTGSVGFRVPIKKVWPVSSRLEDLDLDYGEVDGEFNVTLHTQKDLLRLERLLEEVRALDVEVY